MLENYTIEGYVNNSKFYFYGTDNTKTNRTDGKIAFKAENEKLISCRVNFASRVEEVIE